jgi:hypothetical protein
MNQTTPSLSSYKKKVKIKEINFGTKIEFLKTKGTDHLLNEKNRGPK